MRAIISSVTEASVTISNKTVGKIGKGFLILLGIKVGDTDAECKKLAEKVCGLRIFEDENGKMNLNLASVGGEILVVSQFTLYADCKSRRPGFTAAARPETAVPLYELFISECSDRGFHVETGEFGAMMMVESVNNGPCTIIMDTDEL